MKYLKTKINHISLIASLLLVLTFMACEVDCRKRGNCPAEYYRNDLGEAKDYLWAAKGSYWIYKNSKTGELDTQTCMSSKTYWLNVRGSYKETQHITIDYEVLTRSIYSSYNNWVYYDKTTGHNPDAISFTDYKKLGREVSGEGVNIPFAFPFLIGKGGSNGSSSTTCTNADTNMLVNGILYEHVVVFDINIDPIWENKLFCVRPNTRYFWAKNVGLIKKEMNRCGYSWDLIESQILK